MPKRATLDPNQFKINLPKPRRDPLESVIPTTPPPETNTTNRPTGHPAQRPTSQRVESNIDREAKRSTVRKTVRSEGRKRKRLIKRHGFDVFQDQIMSLNKIQFELYIRRGKKPSIGELVRPALDKLIAEKLKELGES